MAGPAVLVGHPQVAAGVDVDAAFAPKEFIPAVAIDVEHGEHVRAAGAGFVLGDDSRPDGLELRIPALQTHLAVGALGGDQAALAAGEATLDEVAVGVAGALVGVDLGPGEGLEDLAGPGGQAFEPELAMIERVVGVAVGDQPDLVVAIAVEVEGHDRAEPDAGDHAGAEIAVPEALPRGGEGGEFERVGRQEEHAGPGVILGAVAVDGQEGGFAAGLDRREAELFQVRADVAGDSGLQPFCHGQIPSRRAMVPPSTSDSCSVR